MPIPFSYLSIGLLALALTACAGSKPPSTQPSALMGPLWVLDAFGPETDLEASLVGEAPTAQFTDDGEAKISGSAGCNNYFAALTIRGTHLQVGTAGATRKMCMEPQGIMQQESRYLKTLEQVAFYRIDGGRLKLFDQEGRQLMVFYH